MTDEVVDLSKSLVWTVGMITQAGPDERERVANAYREAQDLVAQIPKTDEGARPRIVACLHRSDKYRAVEDIACVGWILTAIEERVNEGDLPDWRKLRKVVKNAVKLLSDPAPTLH
jgi:hypothetical protein